MNIAVDIDDTITDSKRLRYKAVKKFLKTKNLKYKIKNKHSRSSSKMLDWTNEECIEFWRSGGYNIFSKSRPFPYCKKAIDKLLSQGHKIIFVTARSDEWLIDAYKLTSEWLKKHKINYTKLICNSDSKKEAFIEEKIDIVIDDYIKVLKSAQDLGIKTLLMMCSHNKNLKEKDNYTQVHNWKQIYKIITNLTTHQS